MKNHELEIILTVSPFAPPHEGFTISTEHGKPNTVPDYDKEAEVLVALFGRYLPSGTMNAFVHAWIAKYYAPNRR
jgi:hypothetical protein